MYSHYNTLRYSYSVDLWKYGKGESLRGSFKSLMKQIKEKGIPLDIMLATRNHYFDCKLCDEKYYMLMKMWIQMKPAIIKEVLDERLKDDTFTDNRKQMVIILHW